MAKPLNNSQTIMIEVSNNIFKSIREPSLIKRDRGKKFGEEFSSNFPGPS